MGYMEEYEFWTTDPYFDEKTKQELIAIKDDAKAINDALKDQIRQFYPGAAEKDIQKVMGIRR